MSFIEDILKGFKNSKSSKIVLAIAVAALAGAGLLSGTETGQKDVVDLLKGGDGVVDQVQEAVGSDSTDVADTNTEEDSGGILDFLKDEKGTGLFSGLDNVTCEKDSYNCADFKTQSEAQSAYDKCAPNDVHGLDRDNDKKVCEGLPEGE